MQNKRLVGGGMHATYSLWLEPPAEPGVLLGAAIASLASDHGTLPFRPHVTLHGAFVLRTESAAKQAAVDVAAQLMPFDITWDRIDTGTSYYQSVYLVCAPSAALLAAHEAASGVCGAVPAAPYCPHLSLIYTEMDAAGKVELASAIQRKWPSLASGTFPVRGVRLMETDPSDRTMKTWRSISFVEFGATKT